MRRSILWKGRYEEGGYSAIEETRSHAPHNPRRKSKEIVEEVKEIKRENPKMGRNKVANEVAKRHGWHQVVSASTVRRILIRECATRHKDGMEEGLMCQYS